MSPGVPELLSCLLQEEVGEGLRTALTVMLVMYTVIRLSHPEQTKTLKSHIIGVHEKSRSTKGQQNQSEEASVLRLLRTRNASMCRRLNVSIWNEELLDRLIGAVFRREMEWRASSAPRTRAQPNVRLCPSVSVQIRNKQGHTNSVCGRNKHGIERRVLALPV